MLHSILAVLDNNLKFILKCITFIQRWPNVLAVGPTMYKCYTFFCICWLEAILRRTSTESLPEECTRNYECGLMLRSMLVVFHSHMKFIFERIARGDYTQIISSEPTRS